MRDKRKEEAGGIYVYLYEFICACERECSCGN